jgi:hypothetical protein
MGPSHAMSGAAGWLAAAAIYTNVTGHVVQPELLILGTTVAAGAALGPDIDSYGSTVVRSFGFVGRAMYWIANSLSLAVYNIVRTPRDEPKENGHRTLFHTSLMAIIIGGLTALATSATGSVDVFGKHMTWGALNSLIIMAIFLNLGIGGLFVKPIAKAKSNFGILGPYVMMAVTATAVWMFSSFTNFIPAASTQVAGYSWLGLAVFFGWMMHLAGDFITKMGVPLLFPLPWKGRLWWNFATPTFMRIKAGSGVETFVLFPLFTVATIGLAVWHFMKLGGMLK